MSIRGARRLVEFDTPTDPDRSCQPGQAPIKAGMGEVAETRVRYGYRRVHVSLQREGRQVNHKKTYWLYRELGLQLRNKTPKRRVKAKPDEERPHGAIGGKSPISLLNPAARPACGGE